MSKDIAKPKDTITIQEDAWGTITFEMPKKFMVKENDWRGKEVWAYTYWRLYIRPIGDRDSRMYRIVDPNEYKRIRKAMATPDVRFVEVNGKLINVNHIDSLEPKKGYKDVK